MEATPSTKLQTFQKWTMVDGKLHFNLVLIEHIRKNHNEAFRNYLKTTKNPQAARDYKGASWLHVTAEYGNEEIVKNLIELEIDVNLRNELGQTALMIALKNKYVAIAKLILLETNVNVQICDMVGTCALQIAIKMDPLISDYYTLAMPWTDTYWEIVGLMLDKLHSDYLFNSEKVAKKLMQIKCPLSHVIFMNDSEVMKIMIEKGCAVNAQDGFQGKTALHWAVKYCKLDKVKILLNYGADVDILDDYESTALMYIYFRVDPRVPPCEVELVKILLEHKTHVNSTVDLPNEMHDIFRFGSKNAVRLVLKRYPDLFLERYRCRTLLHAVAENPNQGIEQSVKDRNIDVNRRDSNGCTALFIAVLVGNYKVVECLLDRGANPDTAIKNGLTPMHFLFMNSLLITRKKRSKCLKLLLEYGADLEIRYANEATILNGISAQTFHYLRKPVLAQFAVRRASGIPISEIIIQHIRWQNEFSTYFDLCLNQLEEAKTMNISKSVSVFEILAGNSETILLYTRNRSLVSKLSEIIDRLKLDSIYMGILHKRFSKVFRIAKLRAKAATVICKNIGKLYGCNPIITDAITNFLNDEDISKLL